MKAYQRYLTGEIHSKLENATTKIAKKVYNVLDKDGIAGIVADERNKVFWFEFYTTGNNCPQYVYDWLKKYIKREYGFDYLYDVIDEINMRGCR